MSSNNEEYYNEEEEAWRYVGQIMWGAEGEGVILTSPYSYPALNKT